MRQKIVIAGGTGFIGRYLTRKFSADGYEVLIISRSGDFIHWNDNEKIKEALEGAALLINLAGRSVDCRYTKRNKRIILESRVHTTQKLQQILDTCSTPPPLWINSSTATIYRHAEDRPMDEKTGEIGHGFSVNVAKAWEAAFFEKATPGIRKVALRAAIVLGKEGGVMKPYKALTRFGLGGVQGNGWQQFSWIHIEDLYRIICFVKESDSLTGIYNAASPYPVSNKVFMQAMRQRIRPLFHMRTPYWMLHLGAAIIGTATELVLKSRWVIPGKLQEAGYQFKYATIDTALDEVLVSE